jgi:hypothetical protein
MIIVFFLNKNKIKVGFRGADCMAALLWAFNFAS